MSHRASASDHQLTLDLDADVHDTVRRARAHRRNVGLPESLVTTDVLSKLHGVLRRAHQPTPAASLDRAAS